MAKQTKEVQMRGSLTDRIKRRSMELLGHEIDVTELRLMPYILTVMMNERKIDPACCNWHDNVILEKWKEDGHISGGASGLQITEEFWNIICEIVRLGYVDLD